VLPALPATPAPDASSPVDQLEDEDTPRARIGKAMHRLLEWGGALSAPQVLAAAREFRLSPAQAREATQLAQRILAGEGAWAWRAEVVAWQGNEVDLVYAGQALRLDRLVQRKDAGHEGHWWVLDYKSALAPQQQPALVVQLQTYRAAVQLVYPGVPVKAAFLTGQGTVVEVS
ncbi:MAG: PD-(D/E)XK nuclease family protein, partial [Polaromonas sp.]